MKIEQLKLQLKILLLQLRILILRQKLTIPNLSKPKHIVVHYDSGNWNFNQVNEYHKDKWGFKSSLGFYCGYHYYIELDGKIIQAREINEEGAHCVEKNRPGYWNKNSVGICLQGNNTKFTDAQKKSLMYLLNKLRIENDIPYSEVYVHKDIKPTVCPGSKIANYVKWYKNQS